MMKLGMCLMDSQQRLARSGLSTGSGFHVGRPIREDLMYTIGIDYGTESGRALLVDTHDGREVATSVYPYKNGVIDEHLPGSSKPLPPDWALQDPNDYLDV